jgi:RNA polymerase sigma-70 factor (ECF subfamily)
MTISLLRFETLIERYHDEIYSYLWRLTNSASSDDGTVDAQDLTQEVFLRAYKTYARLRPDSNYRAWLYKIATNCAYTALKRNHRRASFSFALLEEAHQLPADESHSPDQEAVSNETFAAIRRVIAALPAKQQTAVIMRHVQGLEYAEIAQALGCSEDSARANVHQAIRRLRRELKE